MDADYKAFKENSVAGMTGSTVLHINIISLVSQASIVMYSTLQTRVYGTRKMPFLISWIALVLPLLLSMTLFADHAGLLSLLILAPTVLVLLLIPSSDSRTYLPSGKSTTPPPQKQNSITPLPAISTYRAHMMLMTVLAILAVDFPVFPRSLVKCESYGVSLMDMGVGSFVFSQGLVSAIPLLKDPKHLSSPLYPKVVAVVRKSLPVIALGVVRVLLVKGTEYPEHESEYGTHWNFFITLALLPIFQVFLHPIIARVPVSFLGVGVALLQQVALSGFGLTQYVRTTPRTGPISANKEGIASLGGYLAIHLLGLSAGTFILPPSPGFFRRLQQSRSTPSELAAPRQNDKTAIELASYSLVWWTLLGLASLVGVDEGVSRQMTNLPYVLWVAAFNTSFILGDLLLDMLFFPTPPARKPKLASDAAPASSYFTQSLPPTAQPSTAAPLLEAMNKNGLPLFLLANVGTGVVNISMRTMYASDVVSMAVLVAYALSICWVAWVLRGTRVW